MKSRCGVEIEFTLDSDPISGVLENLRENGIDVRHESYNHSVNRWWKFTTDSSCGYELVSPILSDQTYRQTRAAMLSILNGGGAVNRSCGFHVHIESPTDSWDDSLCVVDLYNEAYDDIISRMLSASRKNNQYCRLFPSDDYDPDSPNRYSAVNLDSLSKYGTIEFRQHQGTLNSTKALAWVQMMDCLVAVAHGGGDLENYKTALRSCLSPQSYNYVLGERGVNLQ